MYRHHLPVKAERKAPQPQFQATGKDVVLRVATKEGISVALCSPGAIQAFINRMLVGLKWGEANPVVLRTEARRLTPAGFRFYYFSTNNVVFDERTRAAKTAPCRV